MTTFRRVLGFTPRLRVSGDLEALDEKMLGHVVAVVRESLSNVARHSKATKASVRLWVEPGSVRVKVVDNGSAYRWTRPDAAGWRTCRPSRPRGWTAHRRQRPRLRHDARVDRLWITTLKDTPLERF